ncbi:uncharacterized protein LOC141695953 [Apium graveolens]|uniref:uncharacterized protein LOC141695953 n=1 Tax=Apium graveolens TaxID=4045 RepID=UPI003D7954F2
MYDRHALAIEGKNYHAMLNDKQADIFETIMNNVRCKTGGLFFVYGYGGIGKTFLWKTIISNLKSEGKIVLAVASFGIASLLFEGGRTTHSRFKIPIDMNENITCDIKQQSFLAKLIVQCDLIIWDEAPMNHKFVFEAVDWSIHDLMRHKDKNNLNKPFGGKIVLLGVFNLEKNMRMESGVPAVTVFGQKKPYADWVVGVGNGNVPVVAFVEGSEPCRIEIPPELHLDPEDDGKRVIIDTVYAELCDSPKNSDYYRDRAILTPLNEDVDLINKEVLKRFKG